MNPEDVLHAHLDRIQELDPEIGAFQVVSVPAPMSFLVASVAQQPEYRAPGIELAS